MFSPVLARDGGNCVRVGVQVTRLAAILPGLVWLPRLLYCAAVPVASDPQVVLSAHPVESTYSAILRPQPYSFLMRPVKPAMNSVTNAQPASCRT